MRHTAWGALALLTALAACTRDNPDLVFGAEPGDPDADVRDAAGSGDGFTADRDLPREDRGGPDEDRGVAPEDRGVDREDRGADRGLEPDEGVDRGLEPDQGVDQGLEPDRGADRGPGPDPDEGPAPVDGDGDGVPAGADCDDSDPFVFPGAPERCNGADDDCDERIDEAFPELGAACEVGVGACAAVGVQVCRDDVSVRCAGEPGAPGPERCNELDDDCDGFVDENLANCDCRPLPERCNGLDDDCDGFIDEGELNACGFCGPAPDEICNGRDDDCDGRIDEGVRNACGACGPLPVEICNGRDDDCDGQTDEDLLNACGLCGPPPPEVCNGLDDDCDGRTDERVLNACGACGPVPAEICNGADDDCDGRTDEGIAAVACDSACGPGFLRCVDGAPACDAPSPQPEACNRLDDDCDGRVDEGLVRACEAACGAGEQRCVGGAWAACQGPAPGAEACNNVDDDCDGRIDENLVQACDNACGAGTELCRAGAWINCNAPQPAAEICNLRDDDCDGRVDEEVRNACGACGPVPPEVCNALDDDCDGATDEGVSNACGGCGPEPVEICNFRDDDCDGQVDEGLRNACGGCGPVPPEACNAADDDCDGQVDEGLGAFCLVELARSPGGPTGSRLGTALVVPGDLNADGIPDVVAGAPEDTDDNPSQIRAISGADGTTLWVAIEEGELGTSLAAGDVVGAGAPQIIAGIPEARQGRPTVGGVRVFDAAGGGVSQARGPADTGLGSAAAWINLRGGAAVIGEPAAGLGDNGRLTAFRGQGNLATLWERSGSFGQRLGERVFPVLDFNNDGVIELVATVRSAGDRATVLVDGATGGILPNTTFRPDFGTERSFGQAFTFGRFGPADEVAYLYGAPRASRGADRTGSVIRLVPGVLVDEVARGNEDDELGESLATVPQPALQGDTLLTGAPEGGYVLITDFGRDAIALLPGARSFGQAIAVSAPLPDGTRRVFVSEPRFNDSRGRVWIYSAR